MDISVVVPVCNEVESLPVLYERISEALGNLPLEWEVVLVDDGSSDGSVQELERLAQMDSDHVRVVLFSRNFGQTAAMAAGIDHATGEVIVLMDADLQNDPADIPMLLEKLNEGYDVVSGWRKDRQDAALTRKLPSQIANRIIGRVTGVSLHDYGCSLKAYRSRILKRFRLYGEMHRFIPAYAKAVGATIVEVPVRHHARKFGKTKYGLGRTIKVILDLLTVKLLSTFASKPMYMFGKPGLYGMALGSFLALAGVVAGVGCPVRGLFWPFFQTGILIAGLGFQCILLGLVAELTMRGYYESQGKTPYVVERVINVTGSE